MRVTTKTAGRAVVGLHAASCRPLRLGSIPAEVSANGRPELRMGTEPLRRAEPAHVVARDAIGSSRGPVFCCQLRVQLARCASVPTWSAEERRCDSDEQDHDHYLHSRRPRHSSLLYVISAEVRRGMRSEE
jgi:hypothetical protein